MTSVLAIKKEIKGKPVVWVGWDSQYTAGTEIHLGMKNTNKAIKFPNFVVLFSGEGRWRLVLEIMSRSNPLLKKPYMKMEDERDAILFAKEAFSRLREHCSFAITEDPGHGEIVIATPEKMFSVDHYFFSYESDNYIVSGSGSSYLMSAILFGYDDVETEEDLEHLVLQSLKVSARMDTSSSEPFHTMKVCREKNGSKKSKKSN